MGCCLALLGGGSLAGATAETTQPRAQLVAEYTGKSVVVTKGTTVTGTGTALADTALHQDQAFFEVLLVAVPEGGAKFCVGLARKRLGKVLEEQLGNGTSTWGLQASASTVAFKKGDVVGVAYDQSSGRPRLDFYHNGERLEGCAVTGIKGLVYPAVSVEDGTSLKVNFAVNDSDFKHDVPPGFNGIMKARGLV